MAYLVISKYKRIITNTWGDSVYHVFTHITPMKTKKLADARAKYIQESTNTESCIVEKETK